MAPVVALFDPTKNRRQRRALALGRTQRPGLEQGHARLAANASRLAPKRAPEVEPARTPPAGAAALTRPGMSSEHAVLLELFGRAPVAYHRSFVDISGGSVTAALWLSHAIECSQRDGKPEVVLSQESCFEATGLTRREQETARARLRAAGLMSEYRRGRHLVHRLELTSIAAQLLRICSMAWPVTVKQDATGTNGH